MAVKVVKVEILGERTKQTIALQIELECDDQYAESILGKMRKLVKVERGFTAQIETTTEASVVPVKTLADYKTATRHAIKGTVGVCTDRSNNRPMVYITLKERLFELDEVGWVIGCVKNQESLASLSTSVLVDIYGKPLDQFNVTFVKKGDSLLYSLVDSEETETKGSNRIEKDTASNWSKQQQLKLAILGDKKQVKASEGLRTLFIAGLSPLTREEDLEIFCSKYGTVTDCSVMKKERPFAFVTFSTPEECDLAVKSMMQGVVIDKRRVRVDYAWTGGESKT